MKTEQDKIIEREMFEKCVSEQFDRDWKEWDEYLDGYDWNSMFKIAIRFSEKALKLERQNAIADFKKMLDELLKEIYHRELDAGSIMLRLEELKISLGSEK